ncbi:MAG: hypothetical protein D6797_00425 [Bdellovibrio sp.]|nr:MAG: hypothetical protein D6797_00425 [Bdellovibrio sp.]
MKIKNTGGNVKSKIFALLFNFAFERKLLTFGVLLLFLSACKETGFQGGDLTTTFNGIESATALSPYSVQLKWNQSSKYDHFKVYRRGASSSIGTAQFSTYTVTGLNPNTTYEFAVTGVTVADGKEEGLDKFVSVTTFPAFTGITASNMTVSSATRIDLSWDMADPSITYNIYVKAAGSSWDFSAPYVSAVGINSIAVTGLKGGTQYCLYMVAQYQDNSSEPTTQDTSLVDANAPCGVTPSALANVAPVSVTPIVPGLFPWFNIPAGGDETYKYEVFEKSTNALIASQTGSGAFRAFSEVPQGPHTYYVKTTAPNGELAQNDVIIGSSANPQSQSINRGLPDTGGTPIFPDVVSGGKGVQTLGSQIVRGDFNCDGLMDIAVSAPEATPYVDPKHVDKMGAVIVYYNYLPPFDPNTNTQPPPYLKTDVAPSPTATAPNPQLIYYPTSSSNMKLGSQLAVGNINGDCQRLKDPNDPADFDEAGLCNTLYSSYSGTEGKLLNIHSCDDLAIATNPSSTSGQSVFVVFGNKDNGLETASATSFYQTDNYSCDIATNNCSPVKITPNGQSVSQFGQSIALGDFNNDSFDDLAIGATDKTTGLGKVFVLRGRQEGVTPIGAAGSFPVIDSTIYNSVGSYTGSAFTANDQFGDVLSPVYNSRECKNIPGTVQYRPNQPPPSPGFDETKCDDLVIGNPQRNSGKGSIVTCKGNMPLDSASDPQQISSWNCLEQYPSSLSSGANYGASLLSVRNFNAYPLKASQIANPQTVPNVTGALFVGAPKDSPSGVTEAGRVYAYYITPESQDTAVGGLQGILGGVSGTHSVNAINTQACNNMNNNVSTAIGATTLFHCEHQALQTSPLESYAHFGQSLGVLDDLVSLDTRGYHYLAVAAPDRDVTASDGSTVIKDAGTIYIFNPDISTLGTETATRYGNNNPLTCTTGVDCTLYLGGVSPYSVTLLYPLDLNEGAKLGLGGIVGGDFNGDLTFGDVITTAPFSNSSVEEGGEVFVFYSNNGFAPTENNVGLRLTPNISVETNYRFEMAKVIGDVNGDSYQDVMTHIDINGRIQTILFYGSSNGLITTPSPSPTAANMEPLLITLNNDPELGKRFYPVGDINGDSYDDVLLLGKNGSYIYYGGFNGLNTSTAPSHCSHWHQSPSLLSRRKQCHHPS